MRYDPLIVHYLARELPARLSGAAARTLRVDPAARVAALETTAGTLALTLHPAAGGMAIVSPAATPAAATVLPLHRRTVVAGVSAPGDERLLVLEVAGGPPTGVRWLVVELLTNQWNAVAVDGTADSAAGGRIVAVLWARTAGGRRLRVGVPYEPPPPSGRAGAEEPLALDGWLALLQDVAPPLRATELIARVAWTSPINASAILGSASGTPDALALEASYERYRALAARGVGTPCLLELDRGLQPYPLELPGVAGRSTPSLLDAIGQATGMAARAASAGAIGPGRTPVSPELLERVRRRLRALEARARRLAAQGSGALEDGAALRRRADVLLANLHALRKGQEQATLPDFSGGEITIELDRALSPSENAGRMYEEARRRERAAARVPPLLAEVEAERRRVGAVLGRAEAGEVSAEELAGVAAPETPVAEIPAAGRGGPGGRGQRGAAAAAEALPFRRYRTSGGLEVRVGRSRRANDVLTFRHSSPDDIWLHARDVGGAHVVLRWGDAVANPPHRDLAEAAVLAALHSRARTSGTVAVDWTRRKYVRKPRKAAPGAVVPERVKTIFVEPDEAVEKRLKR